MKLPFKIDLKDKVIVITGGSGVICSHLAEALGMCKAKIALLDLNEDAAKKLALEFNQKGIVAKGYECNVINKESIEKAHQAVLKDFGACDILINGAGGNSPKATTDNEFHELNQAGDLKTFFDLDESGFKFVFDLNLVGTLLPTQVFAKDMVGRSGCSILNISSMNAFTPLTKIPAYSAAKSSINNFTRWLAVHFSHVGIRVNAIAPGFFVTKQNETLLFNKDGTPTARTEKILRNTPMNRFGEVSELVGSTLFLLSNEASSFVTGVVIPIDGGFSSYSGV